MKKLSVLLISMIVAAFALACSGGGEGGTSIADIISGLTDQVAQIETNTGDFTVETNVNQMTAGTLAKAGRMKAVEGADVKLNLADGSVQNMMDTDGDGVYSTTLSNYDAESGMVVVAKKGEIELRNVFFGGLITGNKIDMGETNEDTTALSLVVQEMVKQAVGETQMTPSIMSAKLKEARKKIDLFQVKSDFESGSSEKFVKIKEAVHFAIRQASESGTGTKSIIEQFEADELPEIGTFTELVEAPLKEDSSLIPVNSEDREGARLAVEALLDGYLNQDENKVAGALAEDALWSGMDKQGIVAWWKAEWAETASKGSQDFVGTIDLHKKDETTAYADLNGFWMKLDTTGKVVGRYHERNPYIKEGKGEALIVKKVGTEWKVKGDDSYLEYSYYGSASLAYGQNFSLSSGNVVKGDTFKYFRAGISVTSWASKQIDSASITGAITANQAVELQKSTYDSDRTSFYYSVSGNSDSVANTSAGDLYSITVNWTGGTAESFQTMIPVRKTTQFIMFTDVAKTADGSVVVSWDDRLLRRSLIGDLSEVDVTYEVNNSSYRDSMDEFDVWSKPLRVVIPAQVLTNASPETSFSVHVNYDDVYGSAYSSNISFMYGDIVKTIDLQ